MRRFAWLLLAGAPSPLAAQGFGVYEHGTCTMGRAGVAAAAPCADGSAIFFNPAGLAGLSGTHLSLGTTFIQALGNFTTDVTNDRTDLDNPLIPVPNFYFSAALGAKATVGLGVYAPYGLETKWPTDFDGRFLGYNTALRSIYVQPTIGYQLHERIKIGVGVAYIYSDLELHQRVDLSQQPLGALGGLLTPPIPAATPFAALGVPTGTDFADGTLEATGSGFAVNFGAIVKITDQLSIGGHWLTRKTIAYDGDAVFDTVSTGLVIPIALGPIPAGTPVDAIVQGQFAPNAPLADGAVSTELTLPPQGSLGLAYSPLDDWTFMADWHFVMWGWFNSLPVDFHRFANDTAADFTLYQGYRDTHGFRLGVEHKPSEKSTFRAGYLYHEGAAPDETVTPLLPEGARNEFTVGFGAQVTPKLQLDLGYQFIKQNDRRGRIHEATVGNSGLYQFSAHLVGVGLSYTF